MNADFLILSAKICVNLRPIPRSWAWAQAHTGRPEYFERSGVALVRLTWHRRW